MPKRKRAPAVNVTVNISESILNFMKPVPVGERVVATNKPALPDSLFPINEVIVRAQGTSGPYITVASKRNGMLMGKCYHCACPIQSIEAFAPPENHINHRKRPAFFAAVDEYKRAYMVRDLEAARAARADVVELRNGKCPSCQEIEIKGSVKSRACKAEWERMRKEEGRCATVGCCENGPNTWQVLQANHLYPDTKVKHLSQYMWWAKGEWTVEQCIAEMRKEATKCEFICGFCHALDKHSNSGKRNGDPATMPQGKSNGTKEEIDQYDARRHAKIRFPKQQFVDAEKLRRGCCANPACRRIVTPETCVAFAFDHRDESTKLMGEGTLAGKSGGVAGLVGNSTKTAALDEIRPVLVAEMDKCRLLCENCHHRKTWYGLVINTEEEADFRQR